MRVSAVIPAYNASRYVGDAIRSALDQADVDVEVVVVDDGSTDGTAEVVEAFGAAVKMVRQTNAGVSSARNVGIEVSTGDAVAFLDADDVWLPHKLSRQVDALRRAGGSGLCYGGYTVTDEALVRVEDVAAPDPSIALHNSVCMTPPTINIAQTGMVSRDVADEVRFDVNLSTSADLDFALRVAGSWPLVAVHHPLALYRTHADQMHHDVDAMARDMARVLDKVFADPGTPPAICRERRRATSTLHAVVGASHLANGDRGPAVRSLLSAAVWHPGVAATAVTRGLRNRLG